MKKIPLINKKHSTIDFSIVDDIYPEVIDKHTWSKDAHGYAVSYFKHQDETKNYKLHRLILDAKVGQEVDHINRNKLDNRVVNLRFVTRSENNINAKIRKSNTSGHKTIGWDKSRNKWRSQIKRGNKVMMKRFDSLEDAIAWRDKTLILIQQD